MYKHVEVREVWWHATRKTRYLRLFLRHFIQSPKDITTLLHVKAGSPCLATIYGTASLTRVGRPYLALHHPKALEFFPKSGSLLVFLFVTYSMVNFRIALDSNKRIQTLKMQKDVGMAHQKVCKQGRNDYTPRCGIKDPRKYLHPKGQL